jgi:DNA-binding transcriptional LysR family regulator
MDRVPLEELAGQAMVTVEGVIGTAVRSALEARGLTPGQLDTVMEGLPLAAAVAAIGRGAGLAFLPAGMVKSVGASTGLRAVPLEGVEVRMPIALVRASQAPMTHLHAHFWSYALAQGAPAVEAMADS